MTIIQPIIDVPPAIEMGILIGKYVREGSVVRDALSGRIVQLLKEAPDTGDVVVKVTAAATARMRWMPSKPAIIVTAVAVTAVVVTGVTVHAVKKQAKQDVTMPDCVRDFNASWGKYLDAIREQRLDMETIDQLINDFDAVRRYSSGDGNSIMRDLSKKEGEPLVFVADYTRKLAEENNANVSDLQEHEDEHEQSPESGNEIVADLRRNLAIQRKIFGDAA